MNKRVLERNSFNENFFPITQKIDGINFGIINNLHLLQKYHFEKHSIPYIDYSNYKVNCCCDFRFGKRFKEIFNKNNKLYGDKKNFFFTIFMDDTSTSFKKKIKVVYLSFLNDLLTKKNEKYIYTISCIETKKFKQIQTNYMNFLIRKIQQELVDFDKINEIKGNCFCFVMDNLECYSSLNLKTNFYSEEFNCRICFHTIKNFSENLEEIKYKNNFYYLKQSKINKKNPLLIKYNGINKLSEFILLENFDYIFSMVTEIQHCESEGEILRDLILFFNTFPDLKNDQKILDLLNFLNENYNIKKDPLQNFLLNCEELKGKVFKNNENLNEMNSNELMVKKKKKKIILSSTECSYLFTHLIVFFYDFFFENRYNDVIQIYIFHYNYFKILQKPTIKDYDIKFLEFLIKNRMKLFIKNNLKIVPKMLISLHYPIFIKYLGPLKHLSSYRFENHNHIIKQDIPKTTKNNGVTSLKANYMFFTYVQEIYYPKKNSQLNILNFIRISNHLIRPFINCILLG